MCLPSFQSWLIVYLNTVKVSKPQSNAHNLYSDLNFGGLHFVMSQQYSSYSQPCPKSCTSRPTTLQEIGSEAHLF